MVAQADTATKKKNHRMMRRQGDIAGGSGFMLLLYPDFPEIQVFGPVKK